MATVEYGRLIGPRGFVRPVAIKRLHPQYAKDPDFVTMFVDEARMSARLHHANLVPTLDVVEGPGELALVMEYVHGATLSSLFELAQARGEPIPVRVAVTLASGVLHGLHAAHETRNDHGEPIQLVHRDVSPHNVLVGADGVPRVLDFGVAKALGRLRTTPSGEIKGKLAYIAPEQLCGAAVDRRADVYGASAVLWEALAGRQLFDEQNESTIVHAVLHKVVPPPSSENPEVSAALDAIVLRGLSRAVDERFASAHEMALALEREVGVVAQSDIADWLQRIAGAQLAARARTVQQLQETAERSASAAPPAFGAQATRKLELSDQTPSDSQSHIESRLLRQRPRLGLWLVLLASVVAVGGWAWAQWGASDAVVARDGDAQRAGRRPAPTKMEPEESVQQPAPAPAQVPVLTPAPAITPAPAPAPAPALTPKPTHAHAKPRPPKPASSRAAERKADCVPPYIIDRTGIRRPKPECL